MIGLADTSWRTIGQNVWLAFALSVVLILLAAWGVLDPLTLFVRVWRGRCRCKQRSYSAAQASSNSRPQRIAADTGFDIICCDFGHRLVKFVSASLFRAFQDSDHGFQRWAARICAPQGRNHDNDFVIETQPAPDPLLNAPGEFRTLRGFGLKQIHLQISGPYATVGGVAGKSKVAALVLTPEQRQSLEGVEFFTHCPDARSRASADTASALRG